MAFTSAGFLIFVLVVVLAFNASTRVLWREMVLSTANLVFIVSFIKVPLQLVPLAGFLALGFLCSRLIARYPGPRVLTTLVSLIVLSFVILKRYTFLPGEVTLPFSYLSVGLSYILFRMLQLVIDGATPTEQRHLSLLAYLNYTCNFLCFVSGPIQRAEDFIADRHNQRGRVLDDGRVLGALSRIVLGYFKLAVVSALAQAAFAAVSAPLLNQHAGLSSVHFMLDDGLAVTAYTIYLYSNFAGYMDIVIGLGWLLGQDLPENFDRPFAARNLFEFWSRWHMTLSEWFKTYLFNPLVKAFAARVPKISLLPYLGVLAFFISFFVMGVWHGSTMVFVIYGLVMGAGVSINKLWQIAMTKQLGKKGYRKLAESARYAALAQGLTFGFFAMAVTALWVDFEQLSHIAQTLGAIGALTVLIMVSLGASMVFAVARFCKRALPSLAIVRRWLSNLPTRHTALAAQVIVILIVASFFHKAPEFVYKAF